MWDFALVNGAGRDASVGRLLEILVSSKTEEVGGENGKKDFPRLLFCRNSESVKTSCLNSQRCAA